MTTRPAPAPGDNATVLERFLRLFTDVRAGEGLAAVLMMVTLFLILSGYYILKTLREGLILTTGGMGGLGGDELKMYATGGMALLMLVVVPAYGNLASRVRRRQLLAVSYGVMIACLAVFVVLGLAGAPVGLVYYLWLGIINMFVIAQFWSFANDIYSEDEGKRLFAIIAVGGSLGAWLGPKLAALGSTFPMMAVAGVMFTAALGLFWIIDGLRRGGRVEDAGQSTAGQVDAPLAKEGGFTLVLRDRYLLAIAVMLILATLVNSIGEFILSNAAKTHAEAMVPAGSLDAGALKAARGAVINEFYGSFYSWMNLLSFLIQSLLVSRIIKYAGVRIGLFVLPAVALGGYAAIGLVGGIALIRVAKIVENATDYSLQNTVRHALFLPTSREVKYKAKAAIDMFFVRFGDTFAAIFVFVGIHYVGFNAEQFAFVNLGVIVAWIAVALVIARHHKELETRGLPTAVAK